MFHTSSPRCIRRKLQTLLDLNVKLVCYSKLGIQLRGKVYRIEENRDYLIGWMYIYIYVYIYVHVCMCIYIY